MSSHTLAPTNICDVSHSVCRSPLTDLGHISSVTFVVCLWSQKGNFDVSPKRSDSVLGLVHSDVCGKMSTQSLSGSEYFLTFINDKTRYTWVYILKRKDRVFEQFLEWTDLAEKSSPGAESLQDQQWWWIHIDRVRRVTEEGRHQARVNISENP